MSFLVSSPVPRSKLQLIAAFAVVVLGLAVVDALVLFAVEPQLQALRDIANDHARAVQITTRIRARIASARGDALAAMTGAPSSSVRDVTGELARIQADTDMLLSFADTPRERADLASLRAAIERCGDEAVRIEDHLRRGDPEAARARTETFVELTRLANEAADQIVSFNAGQVENLSRQIRRSLSSALLGATVLTVLGAGGAVLMLRRALRGIAFEESMANARADELDAFAARAAHELRTPLQTMSLALTTLQRGGSPGALEKALRSANRLRETVDGLLEFARSSASSPGAGSADVRRVVDDVREDLEQLLSPTHVALEVDVPPGTSVAMPAGHLGTVMRNLVGNALKFASDAPNARVRIRVSPAGHCVHLEVADNGPGIPAAALPRVFEPFFRASSRAVGHGLGLSTVRRLVEAHGGKVRISSPPGQGTRVALDLPTVVAGGVIRSEDRAGSISS
jgi:signal transduction histidine kinase